MGEQCNGRRKKSTEKKRPEIILSCPALIARHLFCPPVNCLWWLDESLVSGLAFRLRSLRGKWRLSAWHLLLYKGMGHESLIASLFALVCGVRSVICYLSFFLSFFICWFREEQMCVLQPFSANQDMCTCMNHKYPTPGNVCTSIGPFNKQE